MLQNELRSLMIKFIDKELTISEFEEKLVPRLPEFIKDPDSSEADIVSAIELSLVDFACGIKNEENVRTFISYLLSQQPSVWVNYPIDMSTMTSSSSDTEMSNIGDWAHDMEYAIELT